MNAARIELALVLEHLGVPTDLRTFSNRLNVQKQVYLAQVLGTDLGYRFGWYIRGPYATGLTQDAFALRDEIASGDTEHQGYRLDAATVKKLDAAKRLFETPVGFKGSDDDWLELLASVHYLRHIAYRPPGAKREFNDVFTLLAESKPKFSGWNSEGRQAWKRLDEFGLIQAKTVN
jgi:hypothetical protein